MLLSGWNCSWWGLRPVWLCNERLCVHTFGESRRADVNSMSIQVMSWCCTVLSEGGPPYQPSPYPSGKTLLSRKETTPRSTPITDGSIPGEQQVQDEALLRPGLEPKTSQPQRSVLPLDHTGLVPLVRRSVHRFVRSSVRPSVMFFFLNCKN